ncbi:MAG: ferritin-like domain-containing protein [Polyangiaceae bacterium]
MSATAQPNAETKAIILALNSCIEACTDGQKGYAIAASDARASDLKVYLQRCSDKRAEFVLQLQRALRSFGGVPENQGSARGALHRGWLDVRLAVEGRSDAVVLEECALGDGAARFVYERALADTFEDLPREVRMMLQAQYASIGACRDELERRLRRNAC